MPVKTEWDRAARAFLIVTNQRPCGPFAVSIKQTRRSHQHTSIDPQVVSRFGTTATYIAPYGVPDVAWAFTQVFGGTHPLVTPGNTPFQI